MTTNWQRQKYDKLLKKLGELQAKNIMRET